MSISKLFRIILFITAGTALLTGCGGGGGGDGAQVAVTGVAQKGPLIKGSTVTVQELDDNLSPTGKQYTYQVDSDLGTFKPTSKFGTKYISLYATGYYYDECTNAVSTATLTLFSLCDLSSESTVNINLLTTLAYQRIINLVKNTHMTFSSAQKQAEKEVFAAFNIRNIESFGRFGQLDISKGRDGDNALATISSIMAQGNTSGQLSVMIADFQSDVADNGVIDSAVLKNAIATSSATLSPTAIASNLSQKYGALGRSFGSTDISKWLDHDGDGIIGNFKFAVTNATPSTAYTSPAYTAGPDDNGAMVSVSAGTLFINGVEKSSGAVVSTGDVITISLTSRANANESVVSYLTSGTRPIARFTVTTPPILLSSIASIDNIGFAGGVALSPDNKALYVTSFVSCDNFCESAPDDGGLYVFDTITPATSTKIGLAQYPHPWYHTTMYTSLVTSSDAKTAYVASAEMELQIMDISTPSSPTLLSRAPTTTQALTVVTSADGKSAFVGTSGSEIIQFDITDPQSPTIKKRINTLQYAQPRGFSVSPDGTQLAFANQGQLQVIDTSSGVLGTITDISDTVSHAFAIVYIGNKKTLIVTPASFTIVDLATPLTPVILSKIPATNFPKWDPANVVDINVGMRYIPSSHRLYVSYAGIINVLDLTDLLYPVVRATGTLSGGAPGYTSGMYDGVAVSSDESTIYATYKGQVKVLKFP